MAGKRAKKRIQALTMREIMRLPSLKDSKVIAGAAGLDHKVTNAMIIEGPDVEKWAKPGFVLITSFFALEPLAEHERREFFQKLEELDIAGIIYKPDRLISDAIDTYLAICDCSGIAVIQMDSSTTYESVLMDIMGHVIDANFSLLNTFYDIHQKTIRLAVEQPSTHEIIARLKAQTGYDVTYFDRTRNVRIGTDQKWRNFEPIRFEELHYPHYQGFHYFDAQIVYKDGTRGNVTALLMALQSGTPSYLVVHVPPNDISEIDRMIVENYASLMLLELLKQEAIERELFSRNNMVVNDLLQNRYSSHEEIDDAVRRLSIDSHKQYQVMLLRVSITDPSRSNQVHDLFSTFSRRIKQLYKNAVFFEGGDRIVFLRNHTSRSIGFSRDAITDILSDMQADPALASFVYLVILSDSTDRYSIEKIYGQVMGINKLFDADHLTDRCIGYGDLGIFKFLIEAGDLSYLASYIDPRLQRLQNENPEGFKTLTLLCECNTNFNEAARRLYVHPKTVHYRIRRIEERYKINIHNSNDMAQILMASKLAYLLESS